jgi:hypothetical protein
MLNDAAATVRVATVLNFLLDNYRTDAASAPATVRAAAGALFHTLARRHQRAVDCGLRAGYVHACMRACLPACVCVLYFLLCLCKRCALRRPPARPHALGH